MKADWKEVIKKIGVLRMALLLGAAVMLVVCSLPWEGFWGKGKEGGQAAVLQEGTGDGQEELFLYEKQLEQRLEEILGQLEGISSVDVMITLSSSAEKVLGSNENTQQEQLSEEKGSGEDMQKSQSSSIVREKEILLVQPQEGGSVPYVLKELSPSIQGVLVAAQGEITGTKISEISSAVQALFDLPAHKVKVIEKKSQVEDGK